MCFELEGVSFICVYVYIIYFLVHWVFIAPCQLSSCGHCRLLFTVVHGLLTVVYFSVEHTGSTCRGLQLLQHVGSVVAASQALEWACSVVVLNEMGLLAPRCGMPPGPGIEPVSSSLARDSYPLCHQATWMLSQLVAAFKPTVKLFMLSKKSCILCLKSCVF